jgi:catechol 2,3-dioxygenase-like lactoylglutathione lyase family enzyme
MLDHMTFRVSNIARTKTFYSETLAPLGYSLNVEGSYDGVNMLGFAHPDANEQDGKKVDVWFVDGASPYGGAPATTSCHLCWRAENRAQVITTAHLLLTQRVTTLRRLVTCLNNIHFASQLRR